MLNILINGIESLLFTGIINTFHELPGVNNAPGRCSFIYSQFPCLATYYESFWKETRTSSENSSYMNHRHCSSKAFSSIFAFERMEGKR